MKKHNKLVKCVQSMTFPKRGVLMRKQLISLVKAAWTLLRLIAVVSSSIVTIISSLLPLYLHTSLSIQYLFFIFIFLSLGAIIVHGGLTHLFNDYADHISGTDNFSPAVLSGGSRVIQNDLIPPELVWKLGKWISISLLIIAIFMVMFNRYEIATLIIISVWAAYSYSLPPLRLSYRPFLGEIFSLFPAIFFLGLAGPWIILETIPLWAYQNAVINALVCMGWVMVHHIPDIEADKKATPVKRTSVVWFVDKYGKNYASFPALIYYVLALIFSIWLLNDRFWTGIIVIILLIITIILVSKLQVEKIQQVTNSEKTLLLIAIFIAITLGIF